MPETTITVRGEFESSYPAERATVDLLLAFHGPKRDDVVHQAAALHAEISAEVSALHDKDRGPVTWWASDQLQTGSTRPWERHGKQLPFEHHSAVGLRAEWDDFTQLGEWLARVSARDGVTVKGVKWALTKDRRDIAIKEARRLAVENAVAKASEYAAALGLTTVQAREVADAGMLIAGDAGTTRPCTLWLPRQAEVERTPSSSDRKTSRCAWRLTPASSQPDIGWAPPSPVAPDRGRRRCSPDGRSRPDPRQPRWPTSSTGGYCAPQRGQTGAGMQGITATPGGHGSGYTALASYRHCVERIRSSWPEFLVRRRQWLGQGLFAAPVERVTENILQDLAANVLDWSVPDINLQIGRADVILSSLGIKHLVPEVKRPGTLIWQRPAVERALAQAWRYAEAQHVETIAVSDGTLFYAADRTPSGLRDRVLITLDSQDLPEDLWWISGCCSWPPAPTSG